MDHRTIRGRLDYVTDDIGITGKEWFTISIHANGDRTLQSMTSMDDDKLLRHITYSVDSQWRPQDCTIRITINDKFQGSAWFRFAEDVVECESFTTDAGRISQRWPVKTSIPLFVSHSVAADCWVNALIDKTKKDEPQTFYPRLASSSLGNGGSGPLLGNTTTVTPEPAKLVLDYLGEEEIVVPAGRFKCDRVSLNKGKIPRFETWTHGPDFIPTQARYDLRKKYYVLAELEILDALNSPREKHAS
jgi:hypothetical protein